MSTDIIKNSLRRIHALDELREALELATEEELQHLTQILFCRRFNPLDYLQMPEPIDIQSQNWDDWLDSLEERFRYLAADGLTVLRGNTQQFSYRQAIIQVCRYLKIPYSQQTKTIDLEAEIFLHLVNKAWKRLPKSEQTSLVARLQQALLQSKFTEPLPVHLQQDSLNLFLKGSGVLAVNSILKPVLLKQIARQFALHFANYQVAKSVAIQGGTAAAAQFQNQLTLQTAQRGMAMSAARYGAVRSIFALVGPILWGYFLADLGWKAIATNYSRIIPSIVTLAQIRLLRSESWQMA